MDIEPLQTILSFSYFVGMVNPGLNSLFSSLEINTSKNLVEKNGKLSNYF